MLNSLDHDIARNAAIFHSKCYIILYSCADKLIIRVLKYHADILADLPNRLLTNQSPIDYNFPFLRKLQAVHQFCNRRFARSVMADNGYRFILTNSERTIIKHPGPVFTVPKRYISKLDQSSTHIQPPPLFSAKRPRVGSFTRLIKTKKGWVSSLLADWSPALETCIHYKSSMTAIRAPAPRRGPSFNTRV